MHTPGLVLSRDVESNPGERACVVGSFTRFTHWKREIAPSKDDAVNRWMLLPRLSEAVRVFIERMLQVLLEIFIPSLPL